MFLQSCYVSTGLYVTVTGLKNFIWKYQFDLWKFILEGFHPLVPAKRLATNIHAGRTYKVGKVFHQITTDNLQSLGGADFVLITNGSSSVPFSFFASILNRYCEDDDRSVFATLTSMRKIPVLLFFTTIIFSLLMSRASSKGEK